MQASAIALVDEYLRECTVRSKSGSIRLGSLYLLYARRLKRHPTLCLSPPQFFGLLKSKGLVVELRHGTFLHGRKWRSLAKTNNGE
jgi:hypothetical protein